MKMKIARGADDVIGEKYFFIRLDEKIFFIRVRAEKITQIFCTSFGGAILPKKEEVAIPLDADREELEHLLPEICKFSSVHPQINECKCPEGERKCGDCIRCKRVAEIIARTEKKCAWGQYRGDF